MKISVVPHKYDYWPERYEELTKRGLLTTHNPDPGDFKESWCRAIDYVTWHNEHGALPELDDYVRPPEALQMSAEVMDYLPIVEDGDTIEVALTVQEWIDALRRCHFCMIADEEQPLLVKGHIDLMLLDRGFDLHRIRDAATVAAMQRIAQSPSFIRDAVFLTVPEKLQLLDFKADVPNEAIERAKRVAIALLQLRRSSGDAAITGSIPRVCNTLLFDQAAAPLFAALRVT